MGMLEKWAAARREGEAKKGRARSVVANSISATAARIREDSLSYGRFWRAVGFLSLVLSMVSGQDFEADFELLSEDVIPEIFGEPVETEEFKVSSLPRKGLQKALEGMETNDFALEGEETTPSSFREQFELQTEFQRQEFAEQVRSSKKWPHIFADMGELTRSDVKRFEEVQQLISDKYPSDDCGDLSCFRVSIGGEDYLYVGEREGLMSVEDLEACENLICEDKPVYQGQEDVQEQANEDSPESDGSLNFWEEPVFVWAMLLLMVLGVVMVLVNVVFKEVLLKDLSKASVFLFWLKRNAILFISFGAPPLFWIFNIGDTGVQILFLLLCGIIAFGSLNEMILIKITIDGAGDGFDRDAIKMCCIERATNKEGKKFDVIYERIGRQALRARFKKRVLASTDELEWLLPRNLVKAIAKCWDSTSDRIRSIGNAVSWTIEELGVDKEFLLVMGRFRLTALSCFRILGFFLKSMKDEMKKDQFSQYCKDALDVGPVRALMTVLNSSRTETDALVHSDRYERVLQELRIGTNVDEIYSRFVRVWERLTNELP